MNGVLRNIVSTLVSKGELIEGRTKSGTGYRTTTENDKRERGFVWIQK